MLVDFCRYIFLIADGITLVRDVRLIAGEDLVTVRVVFQVDVDIRMCLPVTLGVVVLQSGEHGSVLHVVSVDDGVQIAEVCMVERFHKDAAHPVGFLFEGVGQIIGIIICMYHRITDHCVRNLDPADGLGVDLLKRSQVDTGHGYKGSICCLFGIFRGRKAACDGFRKNRFVQHILLQIFILFVSGMVGKKDGCQLIDAEDQNACEESKNQSLDQAAFLASAGRFF